MASPAAVQDVTLVKHDETMSVFERLIANNPTIGVEQLERMLAMWKDMQAEKAKAAFFDAFAAMQPELPTVYKAGRGHNGVTYAKNDDIQDAVRPVLSRFGFSLSFRTEFPEKLVKITAVLAHRNGHSERTEFVAAADTSGNKNAIQALGSTVAYGKRYTTGAILNVTTTDERDDDGEQSEAPVEPKDYAKFKAAMESAAMTGNPALNAAWKEALPQHRNYATQHAATWLAECRKTAKAVK